MTDRSGPRTRMVAEWDERGKLTVDFKEATVSGAELIAAERQRQIDSEGWTPEHDDEHDQGELRQAAAVYLKWAGQHVRCAPHPVAAGWPWENASFKLSGDTVKDLVRAGALIAAEIDRLQRG